jgi:hypothetical protein
VGATFQTKTKYWRWWFTASNSKGHGMHSPFVFDFIINVLNDDRVFYAFHQIENSFKIIKTDKKINRLLFLMVDYYEPKNIVIHSDNNIQKQYLAAANDLIEIRTIEKFGIYPLPSTIDKIEKVDFVVFNINEPNDMLIQFEILLSAFHDNSFCIINNIYSNKQAQANWQSIQNQSSVKATIDLFHIGIVLFNQDFKAKQHFKVRF